MVIELKGIDAKVKQQGETYENNLHENNSICLC